MEVPTSWNEYTVAIVLEGSSFTVVPGDLLANEGDRVIFRNLTDNVVTILFPDANLFGETVVIELDPLGSGDPGSQIVSWQPGADIAKTVSARSSENNCLIVSDQAQGCFPYAVYYHGGKEFAHRSAMPRIIIVRKS